MADAFPAQRLETTDFAVRVEMASDPRSDLLSMASVLHRRGVNVLEARLSTCDDGRRVFTASFTAQSQVQAATVGRSYEGLVGVFTVDLVPAPISCR
ncbi:MAG: hypothetical protein ACRDTJ_30550 [Pseudonocardiaceae bacterium]